jgi:hypothetical protein
MEIAGCHRTTHTQGGTKSGASARAARYVGRTHEFSDDHVYYLVGVGVTAPDKAVFRDDLVHSESKMPTWAQDDPARFFREAEHHERANGTIAMELKLSLPRELPTEDWVPAAQAVTVALLGDNHPYLLALHNQKTR